jgi:hypothetical protein
MEAWKLRYRPLGRGKNEVGEQIYSSEADFFSALLAQRNFSTHLITTLPDGSVLSEAALRRRFPPQNGGQNEKSPAGG